MFFSRKKSESEQPAEPTRPDPSGRKGRPTPTRKQAEAARQRPLVPSDRKAARKAARAKRDEAYRREQEALVTGDERWLPARDKGPVRRFVRDWVDARWSASEFILPVMVLFLAAMMIVSLFKIEAGMAATIVMGVTIVMYGFFGISIAEAALVWWHLKKKLADAFGADAIPRGTWFYTYSRMIMARMWRSPRPQVKRGEFPEVRHKKR
ncbi:DUF3043 domain-containing protein [Schaalia sp. 19OD2882]|uniref:DUF3043 domain-containing protein n=1 Tax=Schaalia sp. 19OD2882 TaxID=2794089 RepID=UPI001C1F1B6F|nr:DUF3043 domain-containing protein [Schaalia sp. 19OD2882]QWW20426.1 DUF3043 domain-containing protein [Schaalia sp. 19OD2882]